MEQLLVVLSRWRSHDPESLDEAEILENLFNVLCMMIVRAGRVGEHVAVLSGAAHTAREGAVGPASDPHSQAQVRASRGAEGGCGRVGLVAGGGLPIGHEGAAGRRGVHRQEGAEVPVPRTAGRGV